MNDLKLNEYLLLRGLSRREIEIVEQISLAKTSLQIANALFVTEKTIKFHLTAIYHKLGFKGAKRAQLMRMCVEHRFLDDHKAEMEREKAKIEEEKREKLKLAAELYKLTLQPGYKP